MHIPVLYDEVLEALQIQKDGVYVDMTLGGAGHGQGICERLSGQGMYVAFDKDIRVFAGAKQRLAAYPCKKLFLHSDFKAFPSYLDQAGIGLVHGFLADLGVSSFQLDEADRGFSFQKDGPLDMRMDETQKKDAAFVVNRYSETALSDILFRYGEERYARRIAAGIVKKRSQSPILTTQSLVDVIAQSVPRNYLYEKKHFATRTFQAIRIEVNDELTGLQTALQNMIDRLETKGRLVLITFHSLEDRIVKETFKKNTMRCVCPPEAPVCTCGAKAKIKLINKKVITATLEEQKNNVRARSAKLRIAEKL